MNLLTIIATLIIWSLLGAVATGILALFYNIITFVYYTLTHQNRKERK